MRWSNKSEQIPTAHNMKSQEHDIEQDSEVHVTCDSMCAELGVRMVDTWGVHRNRAGGHRGHLEMGSCCSFICGLVTWACSLHGNAVSGICQICTLFSIGYASIKSF